MELITKDTLTYRIVHFDEPAGRIHVIYTELEGNPVPIDLHLDENGLYPTGLALDEIIRHMAPLSFINRAISIKNGVPNVSDIHALVDAAESAEFVQAQSGQVVTDLFDILK